VVLHKVNQQVEDLRFDGNPLRTARSSRRSVSSVLSPKRKFTLLHSWVAEHSKGIIMPISTANQAPGKAFRTGFCHPASMAIP
jgi:hypothetical protein